jgi:glycerol kinase
MILTLDLGTTSVRCLAINKQGHCITLSQLEFTQHFPQPAWVEHNANEIWQKTITVLQTVLEQLPSTPTGIAITNQRETVIAWEKSTGTPLHHGIVWQCRRTAQRISELSENDKALIKQKTGLIPDAYFSASKIEWLYSHCDAVKTAAKHNDLCFGTIDSWILFNLSQNNVFKTDTSNASRTMLVNLETQDYDQELLDLFQINRSWLPDIQQSNALFDYSNEQITQTALPIHAILGDQQAALFANCGNDPSKIKNTYGTGLFIASSTGNKIIHTQKLLATIGWTINNETTYALEGSIFVGGSAIQWCRDQLNLISTAEESSSLAQEISNNDNVYFVPALTGLGAPHWDSSARGLFIGLTRGTTKAHMIRAVLESLAYQTKDVCSIIAQSIPKTTSLIVDGGASQNEFLMQFQADILGIPVTKSSITEVTAYGVAGVAGITLNLFSETEFRSFFKATKTYTPMFDATQIDVYYSQWIQAVQRSRQWV